MLTLAIKFVTTQTWVNKIIVLEEWRGVILAVGAGYVPQIPLSFAPQTRVKLDVLIFLDVWIVTKIYFNNCSLSLESKFDLKLLNEEGEHG